jgi:hypothetical protein
VPVFISFPPIIRGISISFPLNSANFALRDCFSGDPGANSKMGSFTGIGMDMNSSDVKVRFEKSPGI